MKTAIFLLAASSLCVAADKTFTGTITDSMCGADHKMMGVTPDSKCVLDCVKAGSKYALLEGTNVYELSDQTLPGKFAGKKVKVTGDLKDKTIQVKSIVAAK